MQKLPVVITNAVVTPRKYDSKLLKVPILVLNPSSQLVTLHQDTKIAELIVADSSIVCGISQQESSMPSVAPKDIPLATQELLWGVYIVEKSATSLNNHQQQKLFTPLLSFADVFAFCNDDLGRTNKLSHNIPTGSNLPVCQAARRVPPIQREEVHHLL